MSDPREYVVFDTETTGMPPSARLVEIGAIKVRGTQIIDRFESLVFPECPIPQQVVNVHGIDDNAVVEAPTAANIIPEFLNWVGKCPLVGHNVAFDAAMLSSECVRLGMAAPTNRSFCTLRAARRLLKLKSHSLGNLVKELNLPEGAYHRASADAMHTLHLLWHLQNMFGDNVLVEGRSLDAYAPDIPVLPDSKSVLQDAANQKQVVDISYRLQDDRIIPLRVTPRFFFRRKDTIWMEAFCHHAQYYKSYRLERIASALAGQSSQPARVKRGF